MRLAPCFIAVTAAVVLVACDGEPNNDISVVTPGYRIASADNGKIIAEVDSFTSDESLQDAFDDIVDDYNDTDGGYFVTINCSTGDKPIADGKFAVGAAGAKELKLPDGESELDIRDGAKCP